MMNIYAVANQKGGVSKTTTVQCIGAGLARAGFKVLLIDLDPQSNLTSICHAVSDAQDKTTVTMLEILAKENSINDGIQNLELYDIIPSSMFLASIDSRITDQMARPYRLQNALKELKGVYDYVLIDTPPALGTLTNNALVAANHVIIPAQAEILSLQGVSQLYETIESVKEHANPNLKVSGIVLTRFQGRANLTKELVILFDAAAKQLKTVVFNSRIREAIAIKEAQAAHTDIFKHDSKSNASIDYAQLIKEIFDVDVLEKVSAR
jgi:chromosome partitioning protein